MTANEAIRSILKEKGFKIATLAKMLSMDRRVIDRRIRQKNVTTAKLNEMCKVLGYKIVLMPIDKRLPDNSYEVE